MEAWCAQLHNFTDSEMVFTLPENCNYLQFDWDSFPRDNGIAPLPIDKTPSNTEGCQNKHPMEENPSNIGTHQIKSLCEENGTNSIDNCEEKYIQDERSVSLPPTDARDSRDIDYKSPISKKIKCESALNEQGKDCFLEISQAYRNWLQDLQKLKETLLSSEQNGGSTFSDSKLLELTKMVVMDLDSKLASGYFSSYASELGFWDSVRAMAETCQFSFCELMSICSFPYGYQSDFHVPALVDHTQEPYSSIGQTNQLSPLGDCVAFSLMHHSEPSDAPCEWEVSGALGGCIPPTSTMFSNYPTTSAYETSEDLQFHTVGPVLELPSFAEDIEDLPLDPIEEPPCMISQWSNIPSPHVSEGFSVDSLIDETAQTSSLSVTGHPVPCPDSGTSPYSSLNFNFYTQGVVFNGIPDCTPPTSRLQTQTSDQEAVAQGIVFPEASKCPPPTTQNIKLDRMCRRRNHRPPRKGPWKKVENSFITPTVSQSCNQNVDLQFLFDKELKPSDVGSLGRIILPKKHAEEKLPYLEAKEGLTLCFEDLKTSQIWNMRFRFWPNNKTRMYLLECTGNFVKSHRLKEGDIVAIYKNQATGKYMISAEKANTKTSMMRHTRVTELLENNHSLPSSRSDDAFGPKIKNGGNVLKPVDLAKDDTVKNCVVGDEDDDLIREISEFEADGRSIDEIFNFN